MGMLPIPLPTSRAGKEEASLQETEEAAGGLASDMRGRQQLETSLQHS